MEIMNIVITIVIQFMINYNNIPHYYYYLNQLSITNVIPVIYKNRRVNLTNNNVVYYIPSKNNHILLVLVHVCTYYKE